MGWRRQKNQQQQLEQQKILKEGNPDNNALSHEDIREEQVFLQSECAQSFFFCISTIVQQIFLVM